MKLNHRRKNKHRADRHRDTVRARLLQDEANTKRRREGEAEAAVQVYEWLRTRLEMRRVRNGGAL